MEKLKYDRTEMAGETLLLTELQPEFCKCAADRYLLAREQYRASYSALELLLEPGTLALVDKALKAQHDMDSCLMKYMGGNIEQAEKHTSNPVTK